MKSALTIVLLATMLAPTYVKANDGLAETICSYIEVDNKSRLRKVLKANNIRIRNIYDSVMCDGQTMLRFAITSEANSVGGFIVSKLPVVTLNSAEANGKTLVQWADEFGHSASPVVAIARDRMGEE